MTKYLKNKQKETENAVTKLIMLKGREGNML